MQKSLISFTIFLFFVGLLYYVTISLSPWDQQAVDRVIEQYNLTTGTEFTELIDELLELGLISEILSLRNVAIWLTIAGAAFVSLFVSIHSFIDKLFIRKFYEEPNIYKALRRGVIFYLIITAILGLRLFAGLVWYNALSILVLGIGVELILEHFFRSEPSVTKEDTNL
ncbi:hypothetical protein KC909_04560 [Candidatus Dojkabacteria bacterium]|uniref:Uncharacterized protein n=1 Tax=Candidatus Dojkabacteria bacterium TaxID=2099670 RepID=A0A955L5W1_9BACT|nr:hypothetical protein [Candidatus Dojkabacteria bacterium]